MLFILIVADLNSESKGLSFLTFHYVVLAMPRWRRKGTNELLLVYGISLLMSFSLFYTFLMLGARHQVREKCMGPQRCV